MRKVPKSREGALEFFSSPAQHWVQNAAALNVPADQAAAVAALALEARHARLEQRQAQAAARAATLRYNRILDRLRKQGGAILAQVDVTARQGGDAAYGLARVRAPRRKSPIGPPETPYAFNTQLHVTGAITFTWKCRHREGADGVTYEIHRRTGSAGPFTFCGFSIGRKFTDDTIPPGTPCVTYQVIARRVSGRSLPGEFNVNFGGGARPKFQIARAA